MNYSTKQGLWVSPHPDPRLNLANRLVNLGEQLLCLKGDNWSFGQISKLVLSSLAVLLSFSSGVIAQDINGGSSWDGWTSQGLSSAPGTYANGSTAVEYEIYTTVFEYSASNPIAGSAAGFASGNKILGIGVRRVSGSGNYVVLKFDPNNNSFAPAPNPQTSFGTWADQGDFITHHPTSYSGQPSEITIKNSPSNDYIPCGNFGCGNGLPGIRGVWTNGGETFQMFYDLTFMPGYYANIAAFGATMTFSINYNSTDVVIEDLSLALPPPPISGCMQANACNYNPNANVSSSCTYDCYGCTVTDPSAEIDDNSCALCETTQNFNGAITLAATQTAGAWYVDRWAPSAFLSNATFDGGQRLRHVISEFDGAIYRGAQSSAFYNTQGRKFDLPANTQSLEIELYIPAAWETTGRRMAGLWGTGMNAADAISSYPIIEFASDGDAGPRFQVWTAAGWTPIGLPTGFAYDNWYTLQINLLESGEFLYRVGDLAFVTNNYASAATARLDNVILQGHNTETGVDYLIHWDNLTYGSTCAGFDALSAEVVQVNGVAGYTTYRVFANFDFETDELIAVYGVNSVSEQSPLSITSTGVFYQDANGGLTANAVNPAAFGFAPSLEFDSYLALGALPQATSVLVTGIAAGDFTTAGLTINNEAGGLWYITPGSEPEAVAGADGKVLIGQFTTNGVVSMTVNLQYRGANGVTFLAPQEVITFGTPTAGCTDATACNYNALALVNDGSCTYPGCMDPFADNYAAAAGCSGAVNCVYTNVTAFYVNDAVLTGDVYTLAIGNDSNNGTAAAPFATITKALTLATAGDTIYVDAGGYEEQITINKQVRLLGPNAAVSGSGSRGAEAIVQFPAGAANSSPLIFVSGGMHNVTIAGFDLRCQDATIPNYHYLIGAWSGTPVNNLSIRNNRMYGAEIAVYMLAGFGANNGSGALIEGNYINGGPNVNSIYNRGLYVGGTSGTIQDNVIENTNIGIQYMPYDNANLGFVRRNTVASSLIGLYNNYQTLGAALVTWEQNEVSVAPNPQTGLASLVDGARTTPAIFNGIYINTFGTQGSGAAPTALFQNNTINAANPGGTTSTVFRAVTLQNSAVGATAVLENNSFTGYTEGIYINTAEATGATVTATCNWWGSNVPSIVDPFIPAGIDFVPLLVSGVDVDVAMGFQPEAGACQSIVEGCTNPSACNYDAAANLNNGTCDFSCIVCAVSTPAGTNATFAAGACTDCLTVETFTSAIATGETAAPGVWYTDRYAPSVFNGAVSFLGNNRLRHIISEFDGGQYRPSGLQGGFYDTQGRKLDMPDATNAISIELYVPASWATSQRRMAGLWGTAYDASNAVSGYPIIEFTSTDGVARFRGWVGDGTWVDLGLPTGFAYNSWVTLEISLLNNGQFLYRAGDKVYATTAMTPNASVEIANVVLQGHNTFNGVTYTIHWDNFEYEHGLLGCTNSAACNYNISATCDNGSCILPDGCTDPLACNYNANALCNNGSCTFGPLWYADADGDGFGAGAPQTACSQPVGFVANNTDCDDTNPAINPNTIWYADADGDGFGNANVSQTACIAPTGYVANSTDCDDTNAAINPNNVWYADTDGDGFGAGAPISACVQPQNYVANNTDCDDTNPAINPTNIWYADTDNDGYGNAAATLVQCQQPVGYVAVAGDCDDNNSNVNPGVAESPCNGIDDNCNGSVDENQVLGCMDNTACNYNAAANCPAACNYATLTWYADADGDSYGNPAVSVIACTAPTGYVANNTDCNDNNNEVYPGASGTGDGIDNNCDGVVTGAELVPCAGDFNGDGLRNATDLLMLLGNWGSSGTGDMNNDGTVNSADQLAFLTVFATACP